MPLLKVGNLNKVCYVVFMKWFFFFFREMRTASQNLFKTHCIDGCSPTAFNSSHLCETAVLRERQGKLYWWSLLGARDLSWRQERSWKPGGGQYWKISLPEEMWKNKNKLMVGDGTKQNTVWVRWNGLFCLVLIAFMK